MTDKLYCPWCGDELIFAHKLKGMQTCVCRNPTCKYDGYHFPVEVIQQLIDGKKMQGELERTRKALDIAVDALKSIDWCGQDYANAQGALDEITALEQKDVK